MKLASDDQLQGGLGKFYQLGRDSYAVNFHILCQTTDKDMKVVPDDGQMGQLKSEIQLGCSEICLTISVSEIAKKFFSRSCL